MNDPVGRIMSDCALGLAQLNVKLSTLSEIDFLGIEEAEKKFQKIESKLENLNLHILGLDFETKNRITCEYHVLAETIEVYSSQVSRIIEQKKWLYNKWQKMRFFLSAFDFIRGILSFFGLAIPRLPAPKD